MNISSSIYTMNKFIIILLIFIISVKGYSQNYNYGVIFANFDFIKSEGEININDSTVEITNIFNNVKSSNIYSVLKKANGIIYITDGVIKSSIFITPDKGKKKGFEYDNLITFNYNVLQYNSKQSLIYYSKVKN